MHALLLAMTVAHAAPLPVLPAGDPLRMQTRHAWRGAPPPTTGEGLQPDWDVERYDLAVEIDPATRFIEVTQQVVVRARVDDPGSLLLHSDTPDLRVLQVEGADVSATRDGDELTVPMPAGLAAGDRATLDVVHRPEGIDGDGFLGLHWGDPTWTMHQPGGARRWLVVYDEPGDKAALRWAVRAPSDLTVITNGALESITDHDDGTTTWVRDLPEPVPPYLFAMNVGTFTEEALDGPVPVTTWSPPSLASAAADNLGNTGEVLAWAADTFGPYPWTHYANVVVPMTGAMEHTTATSFASDLVVEPWAEWVNVHEIAHHWWGDHVTCADWRDIWLNEGFASYGEVLWAEALAGSEGRADYLHDQRETYLYWQAFEGVSPLYDPPFLFGGAVYQKGSIVLHQLRLVLGDAVFFDALRAWGDAYGGDVATSADLQAHLEAAHGAPLDWFFDDWVYGRGEPVYVYGVTVTEGVDGAQVDLHVGQPLDPTYRMVVPVEIELPDGEVELHEAWAEGPAAVTSLCLSQAPAAVAFDPLDELLHIGATRDDDAFAPAPWVCPGPSEASTPPAAGCGCAATPTDAPWAAGLALVVLVGRRRRAALRSGGGAAG